jgi:hypothetical protein
MLVRPDNDNGDDEEEVKKKKRPSPTPIFQLTITPNFHSSTSIS